MELIFAAAAVTFATLVIAAIALSLAAPVFWVWMLIDALVREDAGYPGGAPHSRLIWVLLIAFVQVTCVLYYFLVYAPARSGGVAPATTATGTAAG